MSPLMEWLAWTGGIAAALTVVVVIIIFLFGRRDKRAMRSIERQIREKARDTDELAAVDEVFRRGRRGETDFSDLCPKEH